MRPCRFSLFLLLILLCLPCTAESDLREGPMELVFFSLGKADAILLRTDAGAVMIDAGTEKKAKSLTRQLESMGIEHLDALIVTHFDKDHVGGADQILDELSVGRVYEPDYSKDSKQVDQYRDSLAASGSEIVTLRDNASFTVDGVTYRIDIANESFYGRDEENDFSLVVRVQYGDVRMLFPGDIENPRIAELLDEGDLQADLLKVPHHGKSEKLSSEFFKAVSPSWAVVTDSDEEPADSEVLKSLEKLGCKTLSTRSGNVFAVIGRDGIQVRQDP